METLTKYKPEQIQEWQKANNMEVFSLSQLCAILMKFEERENEIAKHIFEQYYNSSSDMGVISLFDKWNNQ